MERMRVVPCLMKSVCDCANIVLGMNVAVRIGSIFIICLVCSTWVTGQSRHGESGPVFTAALSRKLQEIDKITYLVRSK